MATENKDQSKDRERNEAVPKLSSDDLNSPTEGILYGQPVSSGSDALIHDKKVRSDMETADTELNSGSEKIK